eukprot:gnl/TRDRNA2_/TRDRNA2_165907_c0_seq10.p1 gnl/TRDRNA2_/TRDRNA2_165907_c0~~gnl/TRDRNA2_/TRDRNA2_165907_c0_seq10.p1  ORF type:complete len:300 (+),score=14.89 gnl/TRDRNA2_/TRDRNA2_165907_c0_seq10:118-900(+)
MTSTAAYILISALVSSSSALRLEHKLALLHERGGLSDGLGCDPLEHTFIISLKRAQQRRTVVQEEFRRANITKFTLWDAVDKDKLQYPEVLRAGNQARSFFDGQYGLSRKGAALALSHLGIYRHILDNRIRCALIFEDDVSLTNKFVERFQAALKHVPQYDLVKLEYCDYTRSARGPLDQHSVPKVVKGQGHPCSAGYMVSEEGAALFLKANTPLWMNSDGNFDPAHIQYTSAGRYLPLRVFHFDPPLAWQGNEGLHFFA